MGKLILKVWSLKLIYFVVKGRIVGRKGVCVYYLVVKIIILWFFKILKL